MHSAPYLCLQNKHTPQVTLPSGQNEFTLQAARSVAPGGRVWTPRVVEHHASLLTVVLSGDKLLFEMTVFEPQLERL
jgi:hypothetical protein